MAGAGGLFRLGRKIPRNIAMELALTGDPIAAERAHHFGLVNRLVEPGQALDEAIALAEQICANAPLAVRETRKIVLEATNAPDEVGWKMSAEGMVKAWAPRTSARASPPSSRSAPRCGRAASRALACLGDGGDDAVVVEELGQARRQLTLGHVVQGDPRAPRRRRRRPRARRRRRRSPRSRGPRSGVGSSLVEAARPSR